MKTIILANVLSIFISVNLLYGNDFSIKKSTLAVPSIFASHFNQDNLFEINDTIKSLKKTESELRLKRNEDKNELLFGSNNNIKLVKNKFYGLSTNIKILGYEIGYYSIYFLSSFVFDILAVALVIFFAANNFILSLFILIVIYLAARALIAACDAALTEGVKTFFKDRKNTKINYLIKKSKIKTLIENLNANKYVMDKDVVDSINSIIEYWKTQKIISESIFLTLVEQQNLSLNQQLYVLNFFNVLLFDSKNNKTISKIIHLYSSATYNINQSTEKQEEFIVFLIKELDRLDKINNDKELFYTKALQKILIAYIEKDIGVSIITKYLTNTVKDETKLYQSKFLLDCLAKIDYWPDDLFSAIVDFENNGVKKYWVGYLYSSRKGCSQKLISIFNKNKGNQAVLKSLVEPMVSSGNKDCLIYLKTYLFNMSGDANNELAKKILLALFSNYMRIKEIKNAEDLLIDFINNKKSKLSDLVILAEDMLEGLKEENGQKLYKNNNKLYSDKSGPKLYRTRLFVYCFFYAIGAMLFMGLIFYTLFANPIFVVSIPVIFVALIFVCSMLYLQLIKGVIKDRASLMVLKRTKLNINKIKAAQTKNILILEDRILEEFNNYSKTKKCSIEDWRTFYVLCIDKMLDDKNLSRKLAGFLIELNRKEKDFFHDSSSAVSFINEFFNNTALPIKDKTHFYNLLSPNYIFNSKKLIRKNGCLRLNHFENNYLLMETHNDVLYRLKYFYALSSLYYENGFKDLDKKRIVKFFLDKIEYDFSVSDQYLLEKDAVREIYREFLEDRSQNYKLPIETVIEYLNKKEEFNEAFLIPIFKQVYLDERHFNYYMNSLNKTDIGNKKILLYLLLNTKNFQGKNDNKRILPNIFYKRIPNDKGYTLIFLIIYSALLFTLYLVFAYFGLLAVTVSYFILPFLFFNLIGLSGRIVKDIMEETIEKNVIIREEARYREINIEKIHNKEYFQQFNRAVNNYELWKKNVSSYYDSKTEKFS